MILYEDSSINKLRLKFNGVEKIKKNYSQAYQDMFVLSMLNGKTNGTFLEIGAYDPHFVSNTYLLEKEFKWDGISIDIEPSVKRKFEGKRTCKFHLQDALTIDYDDLLTKHNFPSQIDYLQLDVEPQKNTLSCLKLMPLNKYRFSVITYETDFYDTAVTKEESLRNREESREILHSHGYELVVGNVCNVSVDDPFEDWWVDPNVIPSEIIEKFKESSEYNDTSESYMLNNKQ
jgi:hypothetical protein